MHHEYERIRFRCGNCGTVVAAPATYEGKPGSCPACSQMIRVPHRTEASAGDSAAGAVGPSQPAESSAANVRKHKSGTGSGSDTALGTAHREPAGRPLTQPFVQSPAPGQMQPFGPAPARILAEPKGDPWIGRILAGDFRIESFLGAGAAASVYRARQISLERTVAVKVLSGPAVPARRLERLHREAVTLAHLSHPNILQVIAYGSEDATSWMAMEFAEGGDVAGRLKHGAVPWATAGRWMRQTLAGLQAAHSKGVTHRDIKPQNLMLTADGTIRIADFGLITISDEETLTPAGRAVGTPAYMSPEQVKGGKVDGRSDIYSVGATFYQILSGRMPFEGSTIYQIASKQVREMPAPLQPIAPTVPLPVVWMIERMMAKPPELRYQTAAVALADLESYGNFCALDCGTCPPPGCRGAPAFGAPAEDEPIILPVNGPERKPSTGQEV